MHVAIKCNDVDEIVCILARRTNFERQELQRIYSRLFKKPLVDRMNRLKDPDFKTIILNLLKDLPDYFIEELKHAVGSSDKITLMQILINVAEEELTKLVDLYKEQAGKELSEDIGTVTKGDFQEILLCLSRNERLPSLILTDGIEEQKRYFVEANLNFSTQEAQRLNKYLSKKPIDKGSVTQSFCEADYFDLDEINDKYKLLFGKSLEDAIKNKTSGNYQKTLLAMLSSGRKRPRLTAKWIHDALFSSPVNKRHLTRLLITRSEFITYTKAESEFGKERVFFHFLIGNGSYYTPRIYPQYLMDAHRLHKAIIKENADTIICILGRRTNYERQEIKDYYKQFYVQTLEQRMHRLSDENFRNLVLSLLKDLPIYLAELLRDGLYSDKFSTVTYTSIGLWTEEAFKVKEIYAKVNQSDLLKDITETTCGEYQNGLKCLFTLNRENTPIQRKTQDDKVRWTPAVYPESATKDAKILYESLHR
ncbi:unnamed protein product [Trichobilharzia szidati]|nr:unnamed protein product [Trichobilharzia szidati]